MKPYKKPPNAIIIDALQRNGGVIIATAKALNINRVTLWKWLKKYPVLKDAQIQAEESMIDMAESKLFQAVNKGNLTAIIFTLKTKGRNRGYIERQELQIDKDATIKVGYSEDDNE